MLYHLLYPLKTVFGGFNVFRYITFRTIFAILTALIISMVVGAWFIRKLKEMQIGQYCPGRRPPVPPLPRPAPPPWGG